MSTVQINIVLDYEGNETNIKMKNTTKMCDALYACCDRYGLDHKNYILSKKGVQIDERQDATYNLIKDGDVLDIERYSTSKHGKMYEQLGNQYFLYVH